METEMCQPEERQGGRRRGRSHSDSPQVPWPVWGVRGGADTSSVTRNLASGGDKYAPKETG